ncbi:MAG: hypothetical protein KC416_05090, partial [Myxococcales bacterium]|nr:hypothetical protein [Myxococcales bacterium]
KNNIRVNAIAPVAKSRMTETILPPEALEQLDPAFVSAVVGHLCSEDLVDTGHVFAVGGGYVSRVEVMEGQGVRLGHQGKTIEQVAEAWGRIGDLSGARPFGNAMDALSEALRPT